MANDVQNRKRTEGRHLRREATNVPKGELTHGQSKAMVELLYLLKDAVQYSHRDFEVEPRNRILLLDGDRGSGKSTIIHTLRHWMDPDDRDNLELERARLRKAILEKQRLELEQEDGVARTTSRKRAQREPTPTATEASDLANDLIRAVDWLEPLSLDPIAPATNLLAAVLSRILLEADKTVSRGDPQRRHGVLDEPGAVDRALHELDSLRSQAVMAMEGNLEGFAGRMDPESHSTQVNDMEATKLVFASKLNRVLGDILAGAGRNSADREGVYVLAIEDLDMRPSRAAEILRLAYSLKVPRLVFLLVGSGDRLEEALRLAYERELVDLAHNSDAEELLEIERKATELAASSYRKMLPLHHRVRVEEMSREAALALPIGSGLGDRTLRDALLAITPLSTRSRRPIEGQHLSLHALLTTPFYSGGEVLSAPPRAVVDFAEAIEEVEKKPVSGATHEEKRGQALVRAACLIRELSEDFRALVDEDADLGRSVQRRLRGCVHEEREEYAHHRAAPPIDSKTGKPGEPDPRPWELVPPENCAIRFELADEIDVPLLPDGGVSLSCAAHFAHIEDVLVTVDGLPLGHRTEAMFKLIHDGIQLGFVDGDVTRLIRPASASPYAATRWAVGGLGELRVPWIGVTWPTFLHRDAFAWAWNEGIDDVHKVIREASEIGGTSHGAHAILVAARSLLAAVRACPAAPEKAPVDGESPDAAAARLERNRRLPLVLPDRDAILDPKAGLWSFDPDVGNKLASGYGDLLKTWVCDHVDNQDDPLADARLDVLVDIACLCTPEVWPSGAHDPLIAFARGVWKLIEASPSPPENEDEQSKREHAARRLLRQHIRRRRMDRLREHGSPLLALSVLHPEEARKRSAPLPLRLIGTQLSAMPPDAFEIHPECSLQPSDFAVWLYASAQAQPEAAARADILTLAASLVPS